MFEIGDYVLNATNGICKIKEIVELDMSGDKNPKSYFLLRPIDEENDKVYIPVDNADKRIRRSCFHNRDDSGSGRTIYI